MASITLISFSAIRAYGECQLTSLNFFYTSAIEDHDFRWFSEIHQFGWQ